MRIILKTRNPVKAINSALVEKLHSTFVEIHFFALVIAFAYTNKPLIEINTA